LRALMSPARITSHAAALYEQHGEGELYLTPAETVHHYGSLLPDALIEQHLEWRYSVAWRRPEATAREPVRHNSL